MTVHDPGAVMPTTQRPDITFVTGDGDWLWDSQGRCYLDCIQGWAVNALGHAPALVQSALVTQSQRLLNVGPAYFTAPLVTYAGALRRATGYDQVFLACTGAEANEGAIKLARKWGALHKRGAYRIITLVNGFHGRTLATMSASGKTGWDTLFEPKVPGFDKVPINDLAALEAAIAPETVAVMLELVQGEGGVLPVSEAYAQGVAALCARHGLLLMVDEVQTGMGRTGTLLAAEQYGIHPHVTTLGKGLGAGVPLAALLVRESVSCFDPGDQGGTFSGNALLSAVGLAVLGEVSKADFLAGVVTKGERVRALLTALSARYGLGEVRGRGLLLALDVGRLSAPAIVRAALSHGLLLNAPREHLLRFMPALNISDAALEQLEILLDESLQEVCDGAA